jgi:hypothetical protein
MYEENRKLNLCQRMGSAGPWNAALGKFDIPTDDSNSEYSTIITKTLHHE